MAPVSPNSILCVFLLYCFSIPLKEIEDCPENCHCYEAPLEGKQSEVSISLICQKESVENGNHKKLDKSLEGKSINTLVFTNVDFNKLAEKCLNGLIVNNLVFKEGGLNAGAQKNPQNNEEIFNGLKPEKLFVLTFFDVELQTGGSVMNWTVFNYFKELKAIHIEGGTLSNLNDDFGLIPHQKIFTITLNNNKLEKIEKSVFINGWDQLKMMTINNNSIEDLDWITSKLPALWYLDLRFNKLKNIPKGFEQKFPSLRVLKLGDNLIRVLPDLTLGSLLEIKEFSFDKKDESYYYFHATKEMAWILKYSKMNHSPMFFDYSLYFTKFQKWDDDDDSPSKWSHKMEESDFDYENTGYLNVVRKDLSYKNKRLFLSGANIAYNELESHFGSEQYDNQKMETLLKGIADSRGNSVRIFLKNDRVLDGIEGAKILYPIIRDLKEFLKAAQKRNILVIICLWSVEMNEQELNKLIKNRDLHDGYLRNYLRPIVEAISHYNALGAWDIIDEPEKLVAITSGDLSPCDHFSNGDTLSPIGDKLTLESVLNFIGLHLSVIKTVSPRKLTTVTISDDFANLDSCPNCFNYVRDDCFRIPGFKNETGLDFYSINWKTDKTNVKEKITKNDKPVLISRYVVKSDQKFYVTAYDYNFAGILGWDYDSSKKAEIDEEMKQSFDKYRPIQILPDIQ